MRIGPRHDRDTPPTMGLIKLLPFALLVVPLAEIGVFILVGGMIGVLPTIALVLVTAVTGATLLRVNGVRQLAAIQRQLAAGSLPGREIAHGAMMLVAGVLLLTPGFITDTLGLLLFVPAVRTAIYAFLAARIRFATPAGGFGQDHGRAGPGAGDGAVIDLGEAEWRDESGGPARPRAEEPSPWRKPH
jgi:UPF0716 protein FxsA